MPPNLFSVGENNVQRGTQKPPGADWVATTTGGKRGKTWPLKAITASIEQDGNKVAGMVLVSPDRLYVDGHYEAFVQDGSYLGKMDKDTMLLCAESIPYADRSAMLKQDVK